MTGPNPAPADRPAQSRHRRVYVWEHPVLGAFEILVDVEGGLSARLELEKRRLVLAAPTGVRVRTPAELPDLKLSRATLDLVSGKLSLGCEPDLGPFGEQLVSELLRETLLAGFDAAGVLARARDADDRLVVYEGSLVKVDACALSSLSLLVTREQLELTLSRPVVLDFGRLLGKTEISTLVWSFARGALEARLAGRVNLWGRVVERVVPALARYTFRRFVPREMLEPGFDLARDRTLLPHLRTMLRGLTSPPPAGRRASDPTIAQVVEPPPGAPAAASEISAADTPAAVRLGVDPGDALTVTRTPEGVRLETGHGLYLVAPGRPWTRRFRVLAVTWDADSDAVAVEASPAMGAATIAGVGALVRAHAIAPVVEALADLERDAEGRVRLPLADNADLYLPDGTLTAHLDGASLRITSRPRALVVARPRFVRFALAEVAYATAGNEVTSELAGASCLGRLFAGKGRKVLVAELRAWLLANLPEPMRADGYDLFADEEQARTLGALLPSPPPQPP